MQTTNSPEDFVGSSTLERLFDGVNRAFWACGATGWSIASRNILRQELLALRANLSRYTAAMRNDARRLAPQSAADGLSRRPDRGEAERRISVPTVLAARLVACGEDREEMYRVRDDFEQFERELRELDGTDDLFPVDPRGEVGDDLAPRTTKPGFFLRKWKRLRPA